jgi:two-component system sensor histidine kinase UhpB
MLDVSFGGLGPWAGLLARRLWYDRPVQWQLLATFVLINLMAGVAAGAIVIYNAHKATAVEVGASMEVAQQIVRSTVVQLARETAGTEHSEILALRALEALPLRLRHLRHVRIAIAYPAGRRIFVRPAGMDGERSGAGGAPRWFAALFLFDTLRQEIPVALGGRHVATVLVTNQPADEIAEVWQDVSNLAVVVLVANIAVIGLLYLALGRVLGPLTSLAGGLRALEQGRFGHRLARPRVRELADIVDRFNALGGALEAARADNARLNRRLVTVQDDERRQIATELHDELGACLFGLRANVLSVKRLTQSLPPGFAEPMRKRVETLAEVSERIQTTNRRVLRRIRPMAIGHAALADVIAGLVADFERNDADHVFRLDIGRLRHGYGDCIDLTVYRCVQEGVTNAARHAQARTVEIGIDEPVVPHPLPGGGQSASAVLRLSVSDDGLGLAPGTPRGMGLAGMEERVSALGGAIAISSRPSGGARLDITIPVEETEPSAAVPADRQHSQRGEL